MPSRYGPPAYVQNESGEILANALMNATSGFMQKRRQNRQDAQQQLDWKVTHPYIHEGALGPDGNPLPAAANEGQGALSSLAHHLMSVPSAIGGAAKRAIGRGDETPQPVQGATPPATHGGQSVQPVLSGIDPMRYMPPELTPNALPAGASPEATRFAHMLDPMVATAPRTRGLPPMVTTPTDGAHMLDPMVSRAQGTNPLAAMQPQVTPSMGGSALAQQLLNVPGSRATTGAGSGAPVTSADRPSDGRDLAATHPGAFDVATRQFGGSDLQLATAAAHTNGPASVPGPDAPAPAPAQAGQPGQPAPTGPMGQPQLPQLPQLPQPTGPRYSAIDRTHYIDNTETPAAVAERTRMQEQAYQMQLADYLKQGDPLYRAQVQEHTAKARANQRAYNALQGIMPDHPLVRGGYDEGTDYTGALKETQTEQRGRAQGKQKSLGDYNALKAEYPTHTLAQRPFDENTDYAAVLASERQNKGLVAAADRQTRGLDATSARAETKERIKSVAPLALVQFGRFEAAVPTMTNQHGIMTQFENEAQQNPKLYDGWDEFTKQFYSLPPNEGVKSAAERALAQTHLNERNPKLARYIRAAARFAFEDGTIQGRGSTEHRIAMDEMISSVGPSMDPESVHDTQEGRQTRIDGYQRIRPTIQSYLQRATSGGGTGGGNAGTGGKTPPPQSQDEYDHLISAGMSDAQIVQRYGQPANGIKRKR